MAKTDTPCRRTRASTEISSTLSWLNVNLSTLVFSSQFHKDVITRYREMTTFLLLPPLLLNEQQSCTSQSTSVKERNQLVTLSSHLCLSPPALHGNLSHVLILHNYRFSCSHLHVYLMSSEKWRRRYNSDRFPIWTCHSPMLNTDISTLHYTTFTFHVSDQTFISGGDGDHGGIAVWDSFHHL